MEKNIDKFDMLVIDYIQKTYKVTRVKHNLRFRRAMVLDDGKAYQLKDMLETKKIKFKLGYYIETIFACDPEHSQRLIALALGI